ncbi:MAG: hypothetical protein A3E79_05825 [Burkholderiales bacterium RIFCSPHIGHO2_12_FULL_61_11]|nr:MAG: hypothetical protein A3E79_05825 [Burkholderiales bacterium RIFCSPHIGHO2_12_FULL_61_11]
MSLFNWFSGHSGPAKATANDDQKCAAKGRDKPVVQLPQRLGPAAANGAGERRVQRHGRREQLYVAIREAMIRAGVLSARYKFKVLSLDHAGNEFLVMMDLAKASDGPLEQVSEMEALIIQLAKARFEITVPAVYWRSEEAAAVTSPSSRNPQAVAQALANPVKRVAARYEPIQRDEVAAFRQALRAASAHGPAGAVVKNGVNIRSGPHSCALLTGFEDTETAESAAAPALSNTQYGDLN